jgi:NAD(P)-dependent dehydrogenase (short-subunit alcohol dehydrogenase family)
MSARLLEGKIALIVGGSQGIGFATAKMFAEQGAEVIITGRTLSFLKKAQDEIGGNVKVIQSDMSSKRDRDSLFKMVKEHYGRINIAFINAGIAEALPLDKVTEEFFDRHFEINCKGVFFTAQSCARLMEKKDSIILTSSVAASMGIGHLSVYSSTKAAILSLTKTIAADLAENGIRVNAISPGYILTPLGMRNNEKNMESIAQSIPLENRFGTSEEVAMVALFLASTMSSYITGQEIIVDGGLTSVRPSPYSKQ